MKVKLILAPIMAGLLLLSACGAAPGKDDDSAEAAQVHTIDAQQAHKMMQSGDELVIVDVRTAEEYATAHIPGAMLLPNETISDTVTEALPVKDTTILIYCRSGNRSAQAAAKLQKLGYTNVYDFGGINDWSYETEAGEWVQPEKAGTFSSFTSWKLSGVPADESVFADKKLTMVNIWGTFCGPCLSEMPGLGQLAANYADKGVGVVGIALDVQPKSDGSYKTSAVQTARDLVGQTGADYIHLLPSPDLMAAKLNSVSSVPTTIFVDSSGKQVGEEYIGSRSSGDWAKIIDSLMAEMGI